MSDLAERVEQPPQRNIACLLYTSYWPNNWWPTDIAGNNLSNYGVEATFTTDSTGAVNGACGTAKGQTFSVPPTANLCSAGTVTGLTNAGGALSWSCSSQDGGCLLYTSRCV